MRLSQFKALSFDCYGTLIDWEAGLMNALEPLRSQAGVSQEEFLEAYGEVEHDVEEEHPGLRYSELLEIVHARLAEQLCLPADENAAAAFGQSVGDWPAFSDSADALRYLKRHFELIILSNVDRASFARSNERLGVEFDRVFTAEAIGSYKPDLRNFEYLLDRLGRAGWRKATCCTSHRACSTITRPRTVSALPRRGSTGVTTSKEAARPNCRIQWRASTSASPHWKNWRRHTAWKPASTRPSDLFIAAECIVRFV
jgi:2-haloacid dehalogenase